MPRATFKTSAGRDTTVVTSSVSVLFSSTTGGSSLFVVLQGAAFDDAPQVFFTPDLGDHFSVPGISISLGNDDWLFFSTNEVPQVTAFKRLPRY